MRFIFILLFIFLSGCGTSPQLKCPKCPVAKESRYTTINQFKKLTEKNDNKLYVLFAADWCKPCTSLFGRLSEAGISHGVIFLNVDETWAFILSKNLEISSVPALAVIKNGEVLLTRRSANEILVYLLAHVESK